MSNILGTYSHWSNIKKVQK